MITITVSSDLMEQTRSFKTDAQSIDYLKKVKKMHLSKGKHSAGQRPKRADYGRYSFIRYKRDLAEWRKASGASSIKVKIESNKK